MKYAYEDMSHRQFEALVIFLCQKLFGISVQGFSDGPDGGRDAKFVGTAELHPSKAAPWVGTTIIQAKHTSGYNKKFSDPSFYSRESKSCTIYEEVARIKKLREKGELDNYLLVSNRKLSGNSESDIREYISEKVGIPKEAVTIFGVENLETFLKTFPEIVRQADIDPVDGPLIINPDDLAEVVLALSQQPLAEVVDDAPVTRTSYEYKNKLNCMTEEYAKHQRRRYLRDTQQVERFLAAPENRELLSAYELAADDFQAKIIAKRKNYQSFDEVLEYLYEMVINRDVDLARNKRLTRIVLFYMYWHCDIGKSEDSHVETNKTYTS